MRTKRGFTLLELIVVITIIGILVTLVSYGLIHVQSEARDTSRKSDLDAISEAFIARYQDETCDQSIQDNHYPNVTTGSGGASASSGWVPVSMLGLTNLSNQTEPCNGSFSPTYLSSIPTDPQTSSNWTYLFNLNSANSPGNHYRLAASLENYTNATTATCSSDLSEWQNDGGSFKIATTAPGVGHDCNAGGSRGYNYIVGQ